MSDPTGGPAFPNTVKITDPDYSDLRGMNLRDYFAAKAFSGMRVYPVSTLYEAEVMARTSYMMADAMLKAREETP